MVEDVAEGERLGVEVAVFVEYDGGEIFLGELEVLADSLSERALEGAEVDVFFGISLEDFEEATLAEGAIAIEEEDDGLGEFHRFFWFEVFYNFR